MPMTVARSSWQAFLEVIGESPSGKATGFDPVIRRFDPYLLSQYVVSVQATRYSESPQPNSRACALNVFD